MRTTEVVHRKVEEAARASGRSLMAEVEHRLTQSVTQDDVFGEPDLRRIAYAMATAFTLTGQYSAGPDVPFKEWGPASCMTAISSVVVTLAKLTHLSDPDLKLLVQNIDSQLGTLSASRRAEK